MPSIANNPATAGPSTRSKPPRMPVDLPGTNFFRALVAPYEPRPENLSPEPRSGLMYPQAAKLITPTLESGVNQNPLAGRIWQSAGSWKWADGQPISNCRRVFDRTGDRNIKTWYGTGSIGDQSIQFICKTWPLHETFGSFIAEMAFNKVQLNPLHGIYVPTIIGVYTGLGVANVVMELPHPHFWMLPSPDMPEVLKKRCISAFEEIHARGVLHGDPKLHNMVIGGDGRVSILDFEKAKALEPVRDVFMRRAKPQEFRMELRKVKCLLDYHDSRKEEKQKWARHSEREMWNRQEMYREQRDSNYTPNFIEVAEEDRIDPPVNIREAGWVIDPKFYQPIRFVVPGISQDVFASAVHRFVANIRRMEQEGDDSPPSRTPSPPPSTAERIVITPPAEPVVMKGDSNAEVTDKSPNPRYYLRKRKSPTDAEISTPSPKRTRTTLDGPTLEPQPAVKTLSQGASSSSRVSVDVAVASNTDGSVLVKDFSKDLPNIQARGFGSGVQVQKTTVRNRPIAGPSRLRPILKSAPARRALALRSLSSENIMSDKARGKRKREEEVDDLDDSTSNKRARGSPPDSRSSEPKKKRRVSFAAAPDVFFKRYTIPKDMWYHKPKKQKRSKLTTSSDGHPPRTKRGTRFPRPRVSLHRSHSTSGDHTTTDGQRSGISKLVANTGAKLTSMLQDTPFRFRFPTPLVFQSVSRWIGSSVGFTA